MSNFNQVNLTLLCILHQLNIYSTILVMVLVGVNLKSTPIMCIKNTMCIYVDNSEACVP